MIITHKLMAAKMFSYLDAWNLNPCSKWLNKVSNDAHMIMELNLVRAGKLCVSKLRVRSLFSALLWGQCRCPNM